jgi:hypothetical protein
MRQVSLRFQNIRKKREEAVKIALPSMVLGLSLTAVGFARAQPPEPAPMPDVVETPPPKKELAAPSNAFELSAGTGYTQGFGSLQSGVGMPSVATPGVAFDLGLGYRIDHRLMVGWQGEYAELTAERTNTARAFTSGVALQYHMNPMQRVDPWVEVGVGYRFMVEDPGVGPTLLTHGLQLARVRLGLDFRADEAVSLGPVIGADATMFLFQDFPNVATNISDPTVSTFVFAGLQGRFDIGQNTRTRKGQLAATNAGR